jgi:DNA-binding MarR family transcriptional regulator
VGYLMRQVLGVLASEVEKLLEPRGLTNAQWLPLFKLSRNGTSTVAEMARGLGLDAGSTTRLLDRLEAKGLCVRERSSEDRRVVHLKLTAEGAEVAKVVPVALCQVHNTALSDFNAEELEQFKSFLRRVRANLAGMGEEGKSYEN